MKELSRRLAALPVSAALAVDLKAKALAAEGQDIINLCVGEPDGDAPLCAAEAETEAIRSGNVKYTNASGLPLLKRAVIVRTEAETGLLYTEREVAVTPGGKYAVYAAVSALVNPGDEVLLPAPYWTSYVHIIRLAGAVPVVLRTGADTDWKLTPEMLKNAVTPRTKALLFNNPVNPTGAVYGKEELRALARVLREENLYAVSDEIYSGYLYTDAPFVSLAAADADMRRRTVTVNGVSKDFAMTGRRIGYCTGSEEIIRLISAFLSHTTGCPNTAAQRAAAEALLHGREEAAEQRKTYRSRRDLMVSGLSGLNGLRFPLPQGAFYLMLTPDGALRERYPDGDSLAQALLTEAGVAVVPCRDYGAPEAVRLSFSVPEALCREAVRRIRLFMGESYE